MFKANNNEFIKIGNDIADETVKILLKSKKLKNNNFKILIYTSVQATR